MTTHNFAICGPENPASSRDIMIAIVTLCLCSCLNSAIILDNCCWMATGFYGAVIHSFKIGISVWSLEMLCWSWALCVSRTGIWLIWFLLMPVGFWLVSFHISCKSSINSVSVLLSVNWCFLFWKVTVSSDFWASCIGNACFNFWLSLKFNNAFLLFW